VTADLKFSLHQRLQNRRDHWHPSNGTKRLIPQGAALVSSALGIDELILFIGSGSFPRLGLYPAVLLVYLEFEMIGAQ
jgi:hypothetical protein